MWKDKLWKQYEDALKKARESISIEEFEKYCLLGVEIEDLLQQRIGERARGLNSLRKSLAKIYGQEWVSNIQKLIQK